ncbi:MAG: hypothetical protein HYS33_10020 [Acidobacteria bacterium]|nr:hypothetical protein [Acidobacteriota bacterium]MBI1982926.1 hypothetical protein [Acidobacteriota bacterium]
MTLLDAKTPKPPSGFLKFGLPLLVSLILVVGLLYVRFRNYSEERAVARFVTTLHEGNYEEAYRLWRPSASYTYEDFLRGWGEQGDYGKIREFQILGSESKGSTVIVTVRINNVEPPLELVVDRETKGLSYSPF